ncbi:MAG: hypothetical protein OQL06_03745 [Gammaproteobacteria bacterium]|nr:hypothetical protein [Gammaproteobacteria bacterium]
MNIKTLLWLIAAAFYLSPALAESGITLEQPPKSLANWYKPVNKRQVWLHTMFRLRRSMLAIEDYANSGNAAGMTKWTQKLESDYLKIAEMVPEWQQRTKPELFTELSLAIQSDDTVTTKRVLKQIAKSCDNCHATYRPVVAALYRSPDYDEILVRKNATETQGFEDAMHQLPNSINRILIALEDKRSADAIQAAHRLTTQLNHLGQSCTECHKDNAPIIRIMGKPTQRRLDNLVQYLTQGQVKESQKLLGEIGVTVCARCHSIHRTLADLKGVLQP